MPQLLRGTHVTSFARMVRGRTWIPQRTPVARTAGRCFACHLALALGPQTKHGFCRDCRDRSRHPIADDELGGES